MEKITYFYLKTCPYCLNANRAIEELYSENERYREIEIERVLDGQSPSTEGVFDYYYVPTMFVGREKAYEANPAQGYDEIKAAVKEVFDRALSDSEGEGLNTSGEMIFKKDGSGKTVAEITFPETQPGVYTIDHTFVDDSLRGQGMAGKLVQAAVDEIEKRGGEVRATCSYAKKWLEENKRS